MNCSHGDPLCRNCEADQKKREARGFALGIETAAQWMVERAVESYDACQRDTANEATHKAVSLAFEEGASSLHALTPDPSLVVVKRERLELAIDLLRRPKHPHSRAENALAILDSMLGEVKP